MNYSVQTYILTRRNNYTVHFQNKTGLSVDEIRNIFSAFGNVINVTTSGNINGMRFVSYGVYKDAITCVTSLQNHESIKLLPERDQLYNETKINDLTDLDDSKPNKNFKAQKSQKSKKYNDYNKRKEKRKSPEIPQNDKFTENKHNDQTDISGKFTKLHMRRNRATKNNYDDPHDSSAVASPMHSERSFQTENIINNDEIPGMIGYNSMASEYDKSIESLNESCASIHSIREPKIVPAQHVVVANVHKDFGVHYILHLFDKYDPIAVSLMRTIHQTGIRYCHVYFKNLQDALAIEKLFDNFVICGERLIVLRSCRLKQEVTMEYSNI